MGKRTFFIIQISFYRFKNRIQKHLNLRIGELVETYAADSVLTKGKIDITKLRPLLFDMASVKYWSLRPAVGNIGMSENRSKENELKALVIEKSVPLVLLGIKEKP